jgi:hypothetical protein
VPTTTTTTFKEDPMVTLSFRSFDGSTISVLADGRAIRSGITGRMLLTSVGGEFVRYLADGEFPEVAGR